MDVPFSLFEDTDFSLNLGVVTRDEQNRERLLNGFSALKFACHARFCTPEGIDALMTEDVDVFLFLGDIDCGEELTTLLQTVRSAADSHTLPILCQKPKDQEKNTHVFDNSALIINDFVGEVADVFEICVRVFAQYRQKQAYTEFTEKYTEYKKEIKGASSVLKGLDTFVKQRLSRNTPIDVFGRGSRMLDSVDKIDSLAQGKDLNKYGQCFTVDLDGGDTAFIQLCLKGRGLTVIFLLMQICQYVETSFTAKKLSAHQIKDAISSAWKEKAQRHNTELYVMCVLCSGQEENGVMSYSGDAFFDVLHVDKKDGAFKIISESVAAGGLTAKDEAFHLFTSLSSDVGAEEICSFANSATGVIADETSIPEFLSKAGLCIPYIAMHYEDEANNFAEGGQPQKSLGEAQQETFEGRIKDYDRWDDKLVLVVDDRGLQRDLMENILLKTGVKEILHAENGVQAVDFANRYRPDLILMDINMPEMNGIEACKKIRSNPNLKHVPILMVTGAGEDNLFPKAYRAGANDFFPKPLNLKDIRRRVRFYLNDTVLRQQQHWLSAHIQQDIKSARQVQLETLPETDSVRHSLKEGGVDFGAFYRPSNQLGGDSWLHYDLSNGDTLLMVLDVSGHGVKACIHNQYIRNAVDSVLKERAAAAPILPEEFLKEVNVKIGRNMGMGNFCACVCLIIRAGGAKIDYAGCAMPSIYHASVAQGEVREYDCGGLPLGISVDGFAPESGQITMQKDDRLFVMSDGLLESEPKQDGAQSLLARYGSVLPGVRLIGFILKKWLAQPGFQTEVVQVSLNRMIKEYQDLDYDLSSDDLTILALRKE